VPKVARALPFLTLPFRVPFVVSVGISVVRVGGRSVVVGFHTIVFTLAVLRLLVLLLPLVELLVQLGDGVRDPFGPRRWILHSVIVTPSNLRRGRDGASSIMMLVDYIGDKLSFSVTEQGSPMYSFLRFASDGGGSLNALRRTKRGAKVALLSFDLYSGTLLLEDFCKGSFKASRLVVQIGFARDNVVP
jgi:hypothetical protein